MYNNNDKNQEEIFFQSSACWKKNLFFRCVRQKASDYYLTITESKKFTNDDGTFHYKNIKSISIRRILMISA